MSRSDLVVFLLSIFCYNKELFYSFVRLSNHKNLFYVRCSFSLLFFYLITYWTILCMCVREFQTKQKTSKVKKTTLPFRHTRLLYWIMWVLLRKKQERKHDRIVCILPTWNKATCSSSILWITIYHRTHAHTHRPGLGLYTLLSIWINWNTRK